MKNFISVTTLLFWLSNNSMASTCDVKTVEKIEHAFQSNKQVLVLAWSDKDKCGADNEGCGDWSDRLNNFIKNNSKSLEIIKLSPVNWKRVVDIGTTKIAPHSELFLKKDHPSYFYEGAIVEDQVYLTVVEAWTGKPFSQGKEFLPKTVTMKLCK
jgi:hypothetical protein